MLLPKIETAEQMKARQNQQAEMLPIETKRVFWKAMIEDGKSLGEARELAGISDLMVAAALAIQCHDEVHVPKAVADIT